MSAGHVTPTNHKPPHQHRRRPDQSLRATSPAPVHSLSSPPPGPPWPGLGPPGLRARPAARSALRIGPPRPPAAMPHPVAERPRCAASSSPPCVAVPRPRGAGARHRLCRSATSSPRSASARSGRGPPSATFSGRICSSGAVPGHLRVPPPPSNLAGVRSALDLGGWMRSTRPPIQTASPRPQIPSPRTISSTFPELFV
nr:classical arabinogalactan protein 4-like [Aegilops tauschii subsp. strangulata]